MGSGVRISPDGGQYEGQFYNSQANGQGEMRTRDGSSYKGLWRNDIFFPNLY